MKKKKRILILGGFCLLLLITGTINILVNNYVASETTSTNNDQVVTTGNFFTNYRTDRTDTRDQELLYLDAIIASEATSAEAKTNAETERAELVKNMELELVLEGLIKAKGFEDCVVSSLNSNVSVIVKSGELVSSEVAQIVEIIQNQTGLDIDNIRIIPVE